VVAGLFRMAPRPPRRRRMARRSNHPATLAGVVIWAYGFAIHYEVLRADDSTLRAIQEAVQIAEASSNDVALSVAEYSLGVALLSRDAAADHRRGLELIVQARDIWLRKQVALQMVPIADLWVAQARAGGGDRDAAIAVMRTVVDELHRAGRLGYGVWGTGVLAEALLERGAQGDLAEAQEASTGWPTCRPTKVGRCARSRCCGCARLCPGPAAMMLPTGTW